jgi:quercetin dioxygenase-like cupin family protein
MATMQRVISGTVAIAAVALLSGGALATPGSGVLSSAVRARAEFADPTDIKLKVEGQGQELIHVASARQTVIQEIVIAPGGHTGWHSHPGPVVVLVRSGALTFYDGEDAGCTPRTYEAGQAFIDRGQGHVHIARNLSTTENLELWAVYFDVPPADGVFRLDAPDPGNCAL